MPCGRMPGALRISSYLFISLPDQDKCMLTDLVYPIYVTMENAVHI